MKNFTRRLALSISLTTSCAMIGCGSGPNAGLFSSSAPPLGGAGAASNGGSSATGTGGNNSAGSSVTSDAGAPALTGGSSDLGGSANPGGSSNPGGSPNLGGGPPSVGGEGGAPTGSAGGSMPVEQGGASNVAGNSGTAGTAGAPTAGAGGSAAVLNFELIDDLEDGNINILNLGGRSGAWYAFNDHTGSQTTNVVKLNPPRGASLWAMQTTGHGFTTWGAGLGFTLHQSGATALPYDASAFQGVRFFGRSANATARIIIQVPTTQTDPRGGSCGNDCYHHFAVQRSLTTEWADFVVYFSDFKQDLTVTTTTIDRAHLYGVEFLTQPNAPFDVWVDDVAFIKKN